MVAKGDELSVELVGDKKSLSFEPLALVDGAKTVVGTPTVKGASVNAKVVEAAQKGDKVIAIRFKAKKRVNKKRGHRQSHSLISITSISKS